MNAFIEHIRPYIDDISAFEASLIQHKPRAFRMNQSRGVDYGEELEMFCNYRHADVASAYFLTDDFDKLAETISFQTGGIYIQNPSSVLPASILASFMPAHPVILDISAAPGGKTCALSDFIGRRGLIIANEPSRTRLKSLHFNLERGGAWNVKTLNADGRILSKFYEDTFDGILLDAPCSHENHIGLNKKLRQQWTLKLVQNMAKLQKQLITTAFDCLKPGGTLVYSTCTFSVEENEQVIAHLLQTRDAELISLDHPYSRGISGDDVIDSTVLRVLPHKSDMDGFFVAAVRKKGELDHCKPKPAEKTFVQEYFDEFPEGSIKIVNRDVYLESAMQTKGDFYRSGMVIASVIGADTISKRNMLPSAQAVWEFGRFIKSGYRVPLDYKMSLDYLKGFDSPITSEYSGDVFYYGNIGVGIAKIIDNMYKNKLSRYFLYGKNIEW